MTTATTTIRTAQSIEGRAFDILAGICEARGINISYREREGKQDNGEGLFDNDKRIVMHDDLNDEGRLDTLLDLLAQRELKEQTGHFNSLTGKQNNPFARLAKTLMCEMLAESEGF